MIPRRRQIPNPSVLKALQVVGLCLSVFAVAGYLRHSLTAEADSFQKDFERQSFMELTKGETFLIARKLAALAKGPQFRCVSAKKAGTVFFAEENGSCGEGWFRTVRLVREPNQEIDVLFTIQLRKELSTGLVLFVIMQVLVGALVLLVQRQAWIVANRKDLELAELARQVGHDIRSPLASLKIALRNVSDRGAASALGRLLELVDHLLGRQMPSAVAKVGALLESVQKEKSLELGEGVDISVLVSGGVERQVLPGGAFFWHRVLSNLVNNSFEARAGARCKIQLAAGVDERNVLVEVVDNGQGIAPEILERLGRAGVTEGKAEGMGLGFYSTKTFIEALGGTTSIVSEVGRGTRVTLRVPRQSVVILVEDDLALAKLWAQVASAAGIELRHFPSWKAFLEGAERLPRSAGIYLDTEFSGETLDLGAALSQLSALGFLDIYLCTGHPPERFRGLEGIRGIVPKEPPWL